MSAPTIGVRSRWSSPPGSIDLSHPLAARLLGYFNGSRWLHAPGGSTAPSGTVKTVGVYGEAHTVATTNNTNLTANVAFDAPPFTMFAAFTWSANEMHLLSRDPQAYPPGIGSPRCWQFRVDTSTGLVRMINFAADGSTLGSNLPTATGVTANRPTWALATIDANRSSTVRHATSAVASDSKALTGSWSGSTEVVRAQQGSTGSNVLSCAAIWGRVLSESEIAMLAADPFCLLRR